MVRKAFTFIEVMAVVVVLGLIAGSAAWIMAEQARESVADDVIGRITHADRLTRQAAIRLGRPYVLRIDIDNRRIDRVCGQTGMEDEVAHTLNLPSACRIDRVMFVKSSRSDEARLITQDSGVAEISCCDSGRSVSYAVRLSQKGSENEKWLIICGLSGQAIVSEYEDQAEKLFSILATCGYDLD